MTATVDDHTALYVLECLPYFENLRQIAGRIAGYLVLSAAGSNQTAPDHPLLRSALELHRETLEGLQQTRCTPHTRAHRSALLQSSRHLVTSLLAVRQNRDINAVLAPLRQAYAQLEAASKALPGFQMVDFHQACCGGL